MFAKPGQTKKDKTCQECKITVFLQHHYAILLLFYREITGKYFFVDRNFECLLNLGKFLISCVKLKFSNRLFF